MVRVFGRRLPPIFSANTRDPDLARKGQVLAIILLLLGAAIGMLAAFNLAQGQWGYNISNGLFFLLIVGLYVLNREGYVTTAALLTVALTATTALVVLTEDSALRTVFIAMMIPILISSFLVVPWGGLAIVALLVVGSIAQGLTDSDYPALLTLIVVAVMSYMFSRSLDRAYRRSRHDAMHDSLTGLPNRALFVDRLQQSIERKHRRPGSSAVLFMDLDQFKVVNDSLGHEAGDELLIGVARRLAGCLRSEDTAARLGGDEFTVMLDEMQSPGDAMRVAQRIADALKRPFRLDEHEIVVSTSIGIALYASPDTDPNSLLRDADVAMYEAKNEGKARYKVFNEDMYTRAFKRLDLENQLRRAIENDELRVHYQPKVSLQDGSIVGMEALARWEHPDRGLIPPTEFIPLAEETGLIHALGRKVLLSACRQARAWHEEFPAAAGLWMSVNLSAKQFQQPNLVDELAEILEETGLPARHLQLEITESVVIENAEYTVMLLERLKDLGVRLGLDDFGKGYSSLSALRQFPLDNLKIDRSFVFGLGTNDRDTAIAKLVVDLAHVVGMKAVGEGVETPEQLAHLSRMGCDLVQGFYFFRPLAVEAASALLANGGNVRARMEDALS